jgi:hypothetical protein
VSSLECDGLCVGCCVDRVRSVSSQCPASPFIASRGGMFYMGKSEFLL